MIFSNNTQKNIFEKNWVSEKVFETVQLFHAFESKNMGSKILVQFSLIL